MMTSWSSRAARTTFYIGARTTDRRVRPLGVPVEVVERTRRGWPEDHVVEMAQVEDRHDLIPVEVSGLGIDGRGGDEERKAEDGGGEELHGTSPERG